MSAEMLVAIGAFISGVGAIIGAVLLHRKTVALLEYRMGEVEKKLDEHNGYAKKFSEVTAVLSEVKTDIAVIRNDISYLKQGGNK